MRFTSDFHLTYCTNIHPGQDWQTTFDSLERHVPKIKSRVAHDGSFGLGLRLSNKASEELGVGGKLTKFKEWLAVNNVYVFSMNGFPYGNFHNERVKDQVHAPDWTTPERVAYTKRLFDQLAVLLPEDMEGGISTSPISYKHWHSQVNTTQETPVEEVHTAEKPLQETSVKRTLKTSSVLENTLVRTLSSNEAFTKGAENLTKIILHLHGLESETGKYLHLDIEPEPDGMLENSDEVIRFYEKYLLPLALPVLQEKLNIGTEEATKIIYRYITVCYDICHFSLAFEEPKDTFAKFTKAGIKIGKIQVSAALKIRPAAGADDAVKNDSIWQALARFDEPTYLHQVTEMQNGVVKTYKDLPVVLEQKKPFEELRAHFHVPIFLERFGVLYSTQDHILKVVEELKRNPVSRHLEIETYTWDVLPVALKKDLSESIIREIEWFQEHFENYRYVL